jgi:hypothetical protein
VLDTDDAQFGGQQRIDHSVDYLTFDEQWDNRKCSLKVNLQTV